jgi:hypothetical protein
VNPKRGTILVVALLALACLEPTPAGAQFGATDTVAAGPEYQAGGVHRFFFGSSYRSIWTTPFEAPVLDLATYAGGLTPVARSGGQQTRGLRLRSPDGHEFFFRSLDKDPSTVLPPDLYETVAGDVLRDQTKSALPTAPLVVARLLTAAGIPHDDLTIVVLPDDSLLGEFRPAFRGLVGTLEERVGGKGPAAHWHGAVEVIDSDSLEARTTRSTADRVDARAFLKARLFDVMIGDWDRHRDQWRWVRFDDREPRAWQPVPLDRDQAFAKFDGPLLALGRQSGFPQLTNYGPGYPGMVGATWNGRDLDRRFLVGLEQPVWDSMARALAAELTDSVIAEAVRALPREHYALVGPTLERWIVARRDALPVAAGRFYRLLAAEVDVHATNGSDRASVSRLTDGAVQLSLTADGDSAAYFERRFNRGETRDLRIFLEGGADSATVRGSGGGITIRVLGGEGNDQLVDSARGGPLYFYDDSAGAATTAGWGADVDRRPWVLPPRRRPTELPPRDWGTREQYLIWGSAGPDMGLFLGGGYAFSRYGFRKLPFAYRDRIRAGFATGAGAFRVDYLGEFHRENSGVAAQLDLRASGIEVLRFHGFGNDTRAPGSDQFYRVTQQQYRVAPTLMVPLAPRLRFRIGPELTYVSTDRRPGRFLATINPYGVGQFGELGARASVAFDSRDHALAPTRGVTLELGGAVHPAVWDVRETFGEAWGIATAALTAHLPLEPTLALRAGGRKLWGAYPFFEAAFIGDRNTVRLGSEQRYAGDASAYGTAELRLSLTRMTLVVPTDVGIFGLADAGRVFLEGESSDTWHSAFGGGIWLGFLGRANTVSAAMATSKERTRLYLQAGFGF